MSLIFNEVKKAAKDLVVVRFQLVSEKIALPVIQASRTLLNGFLWQTLHVLISCHISMTSSNTKFEPARYLQRKMWQICFSH